MRTLIVLSALLLTACGRPDLEEHVKSGPVLHPSLVQSDCETGLKGIYYTFYYKTCGLVGTTCIQTVGDDFYMDGVLLDKDSCLYKYFEVTLKD